MSEPGALQRYRGSACAKDRPPGSRISIALSDSRQYVRGFHPTPVSGTFGAAAGVAHLAGLSGEQIGEVLGLAGCQASGLLTWKLEEGHYTKAFQSGMAARNGLVAAELVAAGYGGPQDTLDASVNIFQTFSTTTDLAPLTDGLGERYEIERTGFKFYGCCRGIHATLDTVLELMSSGRPVPADRIAELTARLPHTTLPIVDGHNLVTHNLQYVLAVTLLDGGYSDGQLTVDRRDELAVKALMERIHLIGDDAMEDAYPDHWRADVTIVDVDGYTVRADRSDPRGTMDFPPGEDEMAAKFRSLAGDRLTRDAVEQILDQVTHLESLGSVEPLATCLRVR